MGKTHQRRLAWQVGLGLATVVLLLLLAGKAGGFLIQDSPRRSDAIVVLAGETDIRPRLALDLVRRGYSRRIVLDVPANAKLYDFTQLDLAENYVRDLPASQLPPGASIMVCPIDGLSTKDESQDAEKCLRRLGVRSVIIVTSDFHTRRALEIFRREVPGHEYSVAAARSDEQFGARWWQHRQWAKVFLDEWMKLIWWKAIDQWR